MGTLKGLVKTIWESSRDMIRHTLHSVVEGATERGLCPAVYEEEIRGLLVDVFHKKSGVGGEDWRGRGFTTVELMIVMAIMGILTLVSVPTYKSMLPAVRVNAAARELATQMQWTRMRAVAKRAAYQMQFDTTNHTVTICTDQNANGSITCTAGDPDVVKTVAIKDKYQQTVVFGYASGAKNTQGDDIPSAVTFAANNVTFKPFSTTNKSGTVYLIPSADLATGRKDRMRAITVLLQTGRVKLWKCNTSCNTAGSWSAS
jgi:prepilin-type N-terminal cleavage/methylation domain-containing protein